MLSQIGSGLRDTHGVHSGKVVMSLRWVRVTTASIVPLWAYCLIVFLSGRSILGSHLRIGQLPIIFAAGIGLAYWLLKWLHKKDWLSERRLKGLTVASVSLLLSMIAGDVGSSLYLNRVVTATVDFEAERSSDRQVWSGEVWPRFYYPTERNFSIFKPNVRITANLYGELYDRYPALKKSPKVASSVLEPRTLVFSIDDNGFRETTPLSEARIFALGDSFTFGNGTTQEKIWPKLLEKAIHEPVYNLGGPGSSPMQELMVLKYMLETKRDSIKIKHLLWLVYEGNDLEDSYETLKDADHQESRFVQAISSALKTMRENSMINRLLKATTSTNNHDFDRRVIDGVEIAAPIYHSSVYGNRLFYPSNIESAGQSQTYVITHPNRVLLDQAFKEMAALSHSQAFKVTTLIAPSDARLYAPYFDNFPAISEKPYFIDYVAKLSRDNGFGVINLYERMKPFAGKELLHWRDDTHWNERGNEVVSGIIAQQWVKDQSSEVSQK